MYTIDGVPLSDPKRRWTVHRESQRRTPVAFRSVDVDVPGVDGNIPIYGEKVEATALALELNVYGTPGQIEERVNFLRSLLGRTSGPIEVERRGGLVADAKPASISDPVMTDHYARCQRHPVDPCLASGAGPSDTWAHPDPLTPTREGVGTLDGSSRPITDCAHPHHRASHNARCRGCRDRLEASNIRAQSRRGRSSSSTPADGGPTSARACPGTQLGRTPQPHRRHWSTLRHPLFPPHADTWAQPRDGDHPPRRASRSRFASPPPAPRRPRRSRSGHALASRRRTSWISASSHTIPRLALSSTVADG